LLQHKRVAHLPPFPSPPPPALQEQAEKDRDANLRVFMRWAKSKVPDAEFMNPGSGAQVRLWGT